MPVEIRELRASDRAAWEGLWTAYLDYYETRVTAEVIDTTFARLIGTDPQDFNAALAIVDGRPVGLVHWLSHRHCWKIENTVYLQDLFTAPDVRGHGVARALIEHVYASADAAGTPSVYWLTQDFNTTARRLYDRIGELTPFIRYNRGPAR